TLRPRPPAEVSARAREVVLAAVDAGDVQLREATQQDLGLRADAAADLEQLPAAAERQSIVHGVLEKRRLPVQAALFVRGEPVQVAGGSGALGARTRAAGAVSRAALSGHAAIVERHPADCNPAAAVATQPFVLQERCGMATRKIGVLAFKLLRPRRR